MLIRYQLAFGLIPNMIDFMQFIFSAEVVVKMVAANSSHLVDFLLFLLNAIVSQWHSKGSGIIKIFHWKNKRNFARRGVIFNYSY